MKTHVFLITAKTNLHVGNESGGEFTIIDKAIQRDPLTGLPCINSSSLKGAIKEYCVHSSEWKGDTKKIFGSDVDGNGKVKADSQKGSAVFFDAKLLYLPQQGGDATNNNALFHYATSQKTQQMMADRVRLFGVENFTVPVPEGAVPVVKSEEQFNEICGDESLPIIARNVLENGESKNLWYEQVLPAEAILYAIIREEGDDLMNALNGKIVQIGAGATIGYGYCQFSCIASKED